MTPLPSLPLTVRLATLADVPFMDRLQKLHAKQVGWMPTKQFEGKILAGHVLIAERVISPLSLVTRGGTPGVTTPASDKGQGTSDADVRVGYVISSDRYMKREDCGIVYQMNVAPGHQRGLIGATLLRAVFERAAYGCRLFCCWCAQDIAANRFWEAMGFVPLAFRSGSRRGRAGGGQRAAGREEGETSPSARCLPPAARSAARTHIFWQRRTGADDVTTPYWYPSQTSAGSIREDRLVFPIPPGTHWSDAKPIVLPGGENKDETRRMKDEGKEGGAKGKGKRSSFILPPSSLLPRKVSTAIAISSGGLRMAPPAPPVVVEAKPATKPKREKRPAAKNDPKLVSAARELRDRYLEHVNANGLSLATAARYDVGRLIGEGAGETPRPIGLLEAARAA